MDLELRDIHKHYGTVHANRGIHMRVASGTIHGILGENGAGKSTLMKVLSGYAARTSGDIFLDGRAVDTTTPAQANRLGIGMLYQDPLDFPSLTVLDNFSLGRPNRGGGLNRRALAEELTRLCRDFDFDLEPERSLEQLTVGERQQLELLRLLSLEVKLLILDEPTTGISTPQKEKLFGALRRLAAAGMTLLLVSHKLEDIESLCHAVTVLRQGRVSGEMTAPFQLDELVNLMFGTIPAPPPRGAVASGEPVLLLHEATARGDRAGLGNCTVSVRRGQMVGLAGLEGSGQGVFLRLAAGLAKPVRGSLTVLGTQLKPGDHHGFRDAGVVFVPTARLDEGLVGSLTIAEHCALTEPHPSFRIDWQGAANTAAQRIARFRIQGSADTPAALLSGGNQQRLLLSLMPARPRLLLLEQPTRGLDLEPARWIWAQLRALCADAATIVFSSAELDEIMAFADRVLVFYNGSLVRDLDTRDSDLDDLARAIAGK